MQRQSPDNTDGTVTITGISGAIIFVVVGVAIVCLLYAYDKRRENQKLRKEISELDRSEAIHLNQENSQT